MDQRGNMTHEIFQRFVGMYGAPRVADMWRGTDIDAVKAIWTADLLPFSRRQIAGAFEKLKDIATDFPPSLPSFRALCRSVQGSQNPLHQPALPLPAPDLSEENRERYAQFESDCRKLADHVPSTNWAEKALRRHEAGEVILRAEELKRVHEAIEIAKWRQPIDEQAAA